MNIKRSGFHGKFIFCLLSASLHVFKLFCLETKFFAEDSKTFSRILQVIYPNLCKKYSEHRG